MTQAEQDKAAALAAAAPPGVFELGGRTFVLTPLTGPDELAIHQEMRRQVMASAADPLAVVNARIAAAEQAKAPYSPTVVRAMVEAALAASSREEQKAEPTESEIAARMYSLDGARWLVWFRLRKADPAVTLPWVAGHIPDDAAKNDVYSRLLALSGYRELDPKKA